MLEEETRTESSGGRRSDGSNDVMIVQGYGWDGKEGEDKEESGDEPTLIER